MVSQRLSCRGFPVDRNTGRRSGAAQVEYLCLSPSAGQQPCPKEACMLLGQGSRLSRQDGSLPIAANQPASFQASLLKQQTSVSAMSRQSPVALRFNTQNSERNSLALGVEWAALKGSYRSALGFFSLLILGNSTTEALILSVMNNCTLGNWLLLAGSLD